MSESRPSGPGIPAGAGAWCSKPDSAIWNEQDRVQIGRLELQQAQQVGQHARRRGRFGAVHVRCSPGAPAQLPASAQMVSSSVHQAMMPRPLRPSM